MMSPSNKKPTQWIVACKKARFGAKFRNCLSILFVLFCSFTSRPAGAQENGGPIVQAILFFSPTCPHCHVVLTEVLPPIAEQYGEQLQVLIIDTSQEAGQYLYQVTALTLNIPEESWVVPLLIVGDEVLVGGYEIEQQFPGLIEEGLAAGGIGWPDIPGLTEIVSDLPPSADPDNPPAVEETPALTPTPVPALLIEEPERSANASPTDVGVTATIIATAIAEPAVAARPAATATKEVEAFTLSLDEIEIAEEATESLVPPSDPIGFALGWSVLLILLAGLAYGIRRMARAWPSWPVLSANPGEGWQRITTVLSLVVIGLIVSVYLSYVEVTQVKAACGPVGECNIVQSSPYAQILGVPIALLGAIFYLTVGPTWFLRLTLDARRHRLLTMGLVGVTLLGTLFSVYLTLLELLVIHAICAWCLTSALVTVALFLIVVRALGDGQMANAMKTQSTGR